MYPRKNASSAVPARTTIAAKAPTYATNTGQSGGRSANHRPASTGESRILNVTVVGVVPERTQRKLRHVELAEGHRARLAEAGDRRALDRGHEVVAGPGAARGRKPGHVAEVLVGERHAVQRAAGATGSELGLEGPRRRQRAVRVDGDEGVDVPVEPFDAVQTLAGRLDRRDLPRRDRVHERLDGPVSHRAQRA